MRRLIAAVSVSLAGLLSVVATVSPANASTCSFTGYTDHGVYYPVRTASYTIKNNLGITIENRKSCMLIVVIGDPGATWHFEVKVQDLVDTGEGYYWNNDDGYSSVEWAKLGVGWSNTVADTNSANFTINEGNGGYIWFSRTFYYPVDGPPSEWMWRVSMPTYYFEPNYWHWAYWYSNPIIIY
jgi:hypothetical protein